MTKFNHEKDYVQDQDDIKMRKEYENSAAGKVPLDYFTVGCQRYTVLKYFWLNKGKIVTKKDITHYTRTKGFDSTDIQDARHINKGNGYAILQAGEIYEGIKLKRGQYVFEGFDKIHPAYNPDRRKQGFSNGNFEELKKEKDFTCQTCGYKEGTNHRITQRPVELQKGHKDPTKKLDIDNLILQCSYCNQLYKDKYEFDDNGCIKGLTLKELKKQYDKYFGIQNT